MNDSEHPAIDGSPGRVSRDAGRVYTILGQQYVVKAHTPAALAFDIVARPGQAVPVHIHADQDEFVFVHQGRLDVKLNGTWETAHAGDLVSMPRGVPHGYCNLTDAPCRALFWISPALRFAELLAGLDGLKDPKDAVELAAEHNVTFVPPDES